MAKIRLDTLLGYLRRLRTTEQAGAASDGLLLKQLAIRQDETALICLMQRHSPLVWGVCQRVLQNEQEAEDAFQATFLVLLRKARSLDGRGSIGPWLHTVAYHLALKARTKVARRRAQERQVQAMRGSEPTAEAWPELGPVLDEEVKRLPEKYRGPLVLCYLEGKTNEEAARELGRPLGSMSRHLARGLELLRERLLHRGQTFSSVGLAALLTANAAPAAPAAVMQETFTTAIGFVAGKTAVGETAASATALAEGMLKTMFITKLKLAALAALLLAMAGTGVGLFLHRALGESPLAKDQAAAGEEPSADARPARKDRAAADAYGDPLPARALARLGTWRFRHEGSINSVAFAPDGKALASASSDGIRLWQLATGRELRRFHLDQRSTLGAIAISPDGKTIAAGIVSGTVDGRIRLWETETGRLVRELQGDKEQATAQLVFSPTGKMLAAHSERGDNAIALWDLDTGKVVRKLLHANVGHVAFAPDGKTLASICFDGEAFGQPDAILRLWEVATGKQLHQFQGQRGGEQAFAFSPDGKVLASIVKHQDSYQIRLWEPATGQELRRFPEGGDRFFIHRLGFAPDGKALISSSSRGFEFWDPATGKLFRRFNRGGAIAVSPDGQVVGTYSRGDHVVQLWKAATGQDLHMFQGHNRAVRRLAFASDGKVLATGGDDGTVRLWDTATGGMVRALEGVGEWWNPGCRSLAFSPDGKRLASAGSFSRFLLWDPATGKAFEIQHDLERMVGAEKVAFSPDGTLYATMGHQQLDNQQKETVIHLWQVAGGKKVHEFRSKQLAQTVAFSADSKALAAGNPDGTIPLWDLTTGKALRDFNREQEIDPGLVLEKGFPQPELAFAPDGRTMAWTLGYGTIHLRDVATGRERFTIDDRKYGTNVHALAFAADGKLLASASGGSICLWELATAQKLCDFPGHAAAVTALAFAPDCRVLASASDDTTILLWDVRELLHRKRPRGRLAAQELETLWTDLGSDDAVRAYQGLWALVEAPDQTVALLKERLRPVADVARQQLARWLAELDAEQFAVREKALAELEKLGELAEPALRQELLRKPPLEAQRRIGLLLRTVQGRPAPAQLRLLRGLQVLEYIGTPAAQEVLARVAPGAAGAKLTQEARAALERLRRRS
jgi:RNA polymerase sigma factor (sigma-70 family)